MIVLIDDEVFVKADSLTLVSIFKAGDRGQHRIQVLPPWKIDGTKAVNRWLARQGEARQMIELILELGLGEEADSFPCDVRIRVRLNPSSRRFEELRPEAALQLLQEPFEVLVENFENDWCFLKILARKWIEPLTQLEQRGLLRPRHGGGDTLRPQVRLLNPLRSFVLFDSDAKLVDENAAPQPSKWSEEVRAVCTERAIAHHQLRRRAAENYLPRQALGAWTSMPKGRHKRGTFRTFVQMDDKLRHFYSMRGGFRKDRPAVGAFGRFSERQELEDGFGTSVRDLFREDDFPLLEDWIDSECSEERKEIALKLLRRL